MSIACLNWVLFSMQRYLLNQCMLMSRKIAPAWFGAGALICFARAVGGGRFRLYRSVGLGLGLRYIYLKGEVAGSFGIPCRGFYGVVARGQAHGRGD